MDSDCLRHIEPGSGTLNRDVLLQIHVSCFERLCNFQVQFWKKYINKSMLKNNLQRAYTC